MNIRKLFVAAALLVASAPASADPCFGASPFTDVTAGEIYCSNTEWLKNRGITLGCTATTYCPNDFVTRATMALFMNRLGTALTPVFVQIDDDPGALDPDLNVVVCQTFDINAGTYMKSALAHMTFSGRTDGPLNLIANLVYSSNGGANWIVLAPQGNSNRVGDDAANVWVNTSQTLSRTLLPGSSTRFGIRIGRDGGTAGLSDSRCFLNVQVGNRNEPVF